MADSLLGPVCPDTRGSAAMATKTRATSQAIVALDTSPPVLRVFGRPLVLSPAVGRKEAKKEGGVGRGVRRCCFRQSRGEAGQACVLAVSEQRYVGDRPHLETKEERQASGRSLGWVCCRKRSARDRENLHISWLASWTAGAGCLSLSLHQTNSWVCGYNVLTHTRKGWAVVQQVIRSEIPPIAAVWQFPAQLKAGTTRWSVCDQHQRLREGSLRREKRVRKSCVLTCAFR